MESKGQVAMATRHVAVWAAAGMMLAATAWGGDSRYQTFVTGERIGSMGGAGVALGRGVDACRYNPAGLSESDRASVSLTANMYGFQKRKTERGLLEEDDLESDSFVTIPSLVGGVKRLSEDWVAGFCIVQPDKETLGELTKKRSGRVYSYRLDGQSIWAGPSVAWGKGTGWSFGASLFGIYRTESMLMMMSSEQDKFVLGEGVDGKSVEALASGGVRWRGESGWRAGATVQTPSVHLYDSAKYGLGMSAWDTTWTRYSQEMELESRQPLQVAVGVGFEKEREWSVGVDATWRGKLSYAASREVMDDGTTERSWVRRQATVDLNAGAEYFVAGTYPIRAGFYTGFSAVPDVLKEGASDTADVDAYGVTFSVGRETEQTSLNLGVNYVWGKGYDVGTGEDMMDVKTRATMEEIYFTLTTSYYF